MCVCVCVHAPGGARVVLHPNPFYVPKVLTTSFRTQVIDLPALDSPALQSEPGLKAVCPVRALHAYTEHTCPFGGSEQLFVCFGTQAQGKALSKTACSALACRFDTHGL